MDNLARYIRLLLKPMLLAAMFLPTVATAHVALFYPPAVQVVCRGEPDFWNAATNAGCKLLREESGTYPSQQWNEISKNIDEDDGYDYNDQATVERLIPNGTMLGAANPLHRGLNIPSAGWSRTPLKIENGAATVLIGGTAVHTPSDLYIYLTKAGFNPSTTPLGWSDLELLKKEVVTAELSSPPPGIPLPKEVQANGYYATQVQIPSGRTGDAILFMRYQRHDPRGEGFYNGSYVKLGGGGSDPWYAKGSFIPQGFSPKVGDTVRFRVLGAGKSHNEEVDVRLPVVNATPTVWAQSLVELLKPYSQKVQVGVLTGNAIVYDAASLSNNQNYVRDDKSSTAMSIIPGGGGGNPDPRPPVAVIRAPTSVESGKPMTIDGNGSTFYNQGQKIFQWSATHGLAPMPDAPVLNVVAPNVSTSTKVTIFLSVYDGANKTKSSEVKSEVDVVPAVVGDQYVEGTKYPAGATVTNNGKKYRCKPAPYTAWCAGAAWAYAPGTGSAWQQAWDEVQ